MKSSTLRITAFVALFQAQSALASQEGTITLGGDPQPDRVSSQFEAVCAGNIFSFKLINTAGRSEIVDASINGKSQASERAYSEASEFIRGLSYPYVTKISCVTKGVSVFLAGASKRNKETAFRITFPYK